MTKTTKQIEEKVERIDPRVLSKIKDAIKQKGWKPIQLGRALGFSDPWSSLLLSGKRSLSINTLIKIAEILNVDVASLLPTDEKEAPEISFNEYIRRIVREEIKKTLKNK